MAYLYLFVAIVSEVIATSALKASDGFTKVYPTMIVVIGYALAFYMLTLVLKTIPIGITYAIWSGFGIVLLAIVGMLLYKEIPDTPAIIGMGLIIVGIVIIHLFSDSVKH